MAGRTAPSCRACSRCRRALGCVRTGGRVSRPAARRSLPATSDGRKNCCCPPLTDKEARGAAPVPKVAVLGPGSPCPRPRPSEALWQGDAHLAQRTQLMCWLSENKNFWR